METKHSSYSAENQLQAAEYLEKPESQLKLMWETLDRTKPPSSACLSSGF